MKNYSTFAYRIASGKFPHFIFMVGIGLVLEPIGRYFFNEMKKIYKERKDSANAETTEAEPETEDDATTVKSESEAVKYLRQEVGVGLIELAAQMRKFSANRLGKMTDHNAKMGRAVVADVNDVYDTMQRMLRGYKDASRQAPKDDRKRYKIKQDTVRDCLSLLEKVIDNNASRMVYVSR